MGRGWGMLVGLAAVSVLTLSCERHAARVLGPAQLIAGPGGTPAVWSLKADLGGDEADLYLPREGAAAGALPIALLLQGAHVEKRHYADFAAALARQGFLVVVPNHWRTFPPLPLLGQRILLADQRQIGTTLTALKSLNSQAPAPLRGAIDGERLVVIGHSMGGLAGLEALANRCRFPLCLGTFARPAALRGGVFYGTDLAGHGGGPVDPIDTDDRPVALIHGSRDGASSLVDVEATWKQIRTHRKALLTVAGANHFGLTGSSRPVNPPTLPAIHPDPQAPTADQASTITTIASWSGLFLKAEALGDPQARAAWRRWVGEQAPPVRNRAGDRPKAGDVSVRLGA